MLVRFESFRLYDNIDDLKCSAYSEWVGIVSLGLFALWVTYFLTWRVRPYIFLSAHFMIPLPNAFDLLSLQCSRTVIIWGATVPTVISCISGSSPFIHSAVVWTKLWPAASVVGGLNGLGRRLLLASVFRWYCLVAMKTVSVKTDHGFGIHFMLKMNPYNTRYVS